MLLSRKKPKKLDILTLSDSEKTKVLSEIKQKLQLKIREERELHNLLKAEKITVKGKIVYEANAPLKGIIMR